VDILTPNEGEACLLLGRDPERIGPEHADAVAEGLVALGARMIVLKMGNRGCFFRGAGEAYHVPAFAVEAVDSTAAGDTFNAALAVALAEGSPIPHALRFASAAAAISVTRMGAQASAPSRVETDRFLEERR
jgi:ribokinase